jgi:hypothetical protein
MSEKLTGNFCYETTDSSKVNRREFMMMTAGAAALAMTHPGSVVAAMDSSSLRVGETYADRSLEENPCRYD